MTTKNQLQFISTKIGELETAILHSHSNCLLKFPTSLAKTQFVDEVGCIWVTVKKPVQYLNEFDNSFHVGLNYYKKGSPFYLNIFGIARLVTDPEDINQLPLKISSLVNKNDILLSIRILEVNYAEQPSVKIKGALQRWKNSLSNLFSGESNSYYSFNLEDDKNYA